MNKLNILVTGGNGFIGKHLVRRLAGLGHHVLVLDNLSASIKTDLPDSVTFINHDISQPSLAARMKEIKPDIVYHLAAENRVTSPVNSTIENNVIGTFNVLEASRAAGIKQLIFTSSAAVYGDAKQLPIRETSSTKPISAYGVSKLTGELYCGLFREYFPSTIFRFANVYGPGQNSSAEGGAVAIFVKRILAGEPVTIYGNGRQTRDFVFVADVVDALVATIGKPQLTPLNIGTNEAISIDSLIKQIAKITGMKPKIVKLPKRPMEIEKSLFSFDSAKAKLDWRPQTSLEEGLKQTINWFKS